MRMPDEGNALWQLYLQLSVLVQRELKEELHAAGFAWSTFRQDTTKGRPLDGIPFGRLDAYRAFFEARGFADLLDVARAERHQAHKSAA